MGIFAILGINQIVADEADSVETIDLDMGAFKEGSRTGKSQSVYAPCRSAAVFFCTRQR